MSSFMTSYRRRLRGVSRARRAAPAGARSSAEPSARCGSSAAKSSYGVSNLIVSSFSFPAATIAALMAAPCTSRLAGCTGTAETFRGRVACSDLQSYEPAKVPAWPITRPHTVYAGLGQHPSGRPRTPSVWCRCL